MSDHVSGYKLSRDWFDFCFENPEKISPNHSAVYFFAIEHCNRLGWKNKFGFPSTMAMEAVGIKSYNTYIKTLRELIDFGFITMIEKSQNQYSSNIIALSKFNKSLDKSLDKALIKHTTKQSETTIQTNDSINKQVNNEPLTNEQVTSTSSVTSLEDDVPSASDIETWQSAIRISEYLLEAICEYDPSHRYVNNKPSLKGWVKQIDLGLRRDGRTEDQFKCVIDSVFRKCDEFRDLWDKWAMNIESGKKLRDQFDKIKNQIISSKKESKNGHSRKPTKGDYHAEVIRSL